MAEYQLSPPTPTPQSHPDGSAAPCNVHSLGQNLKAPTGGQAGRYRSTHGGLFLVCLSVFLSTCITTYQDGLDP